MYYARCHHGFTVQLWLSGFCSPPFGDHLLLGLLKDYHELLPIIVQNLDQVIETPQTMATLVARAAGLPLIQLLISSPEKLPELIFIPELDGFQSTQRIEFPGLSVHQEDRVPRAFKLINKYEIWSGNFPVCQLHSPNSLIPP